MVLLSGTIFPLPTRRTIKVRILYGKDEHDNESQYDEEWYDPYDHKNEPCPAVVTGFALQINKVPYDQVTDHVAQDVRRRRAFCFVV